MVIYYQYVLVCNLSKEIAEFFLSYATELIWKPWLNDKFEFGFINSSLFVIEQIFEIIIRFSLPSNYYCFWRDPNATVVL